MAQLVIHTPLNSGMSWSPSEIADCIIFLFAFKDVKSYIYNKNVTMAYKTIIAGFEETTYHGMMIP